MRTIKFRVWDEEIKQMLFNDEATYILHRFTPRHSIYKTLMQFTGLLDKNRKEIYEGDIVKPWAFNKSSGNLVHSTLPARVVVWKNNFNSTGFNLRKGDRCEVIGNIYENKDLIN